LPYRSVVVASVLTALGLAAAPAVAQAPLTITFKETNKGSTFKFVDNPPRATNPNRPQPSAGDNFVISTRLVSASGAGRGRLRATCTLTGSSTKVTPAICYGVFALKEGQLAAIVSSANLNAKTTRGVIVGGTGPYAGARGTFTSVTTKTGANDTVTLTG
jgi:hypothetical protein